VVAGIAAWSSYWHMVHVALAYGERPEVAWVLPFSVDGMLVVASLAITDDRRSGRRVRPVARVAFLVGVSASVAANVTAAAPGWGARLVAAWPAVALLLVVETLATTGRVVADTAQPSSVPPVPDSLPPHGSSAGDPGLAVDVGGAVAAARRVPEVVEDASVVGGEPAAVGRRRVRRSAEVTRRMAEEILVGEPELSRAQVARRIGISTRRLREVLAMPPP